MSFLLDVLLLFFLILSFMATLPYGHLCGKKVRHRNAGSEDACTKDACRATGRGTQEVIYGSQALQWGCGWHNAGQAALWAERGFCFCCNWAELSEPQAPVGFSQLRVAWKNLRHIWGSCPSSAVGAEEGGRVAPPSGKQLLPYTSSHTAWAPYAYAWLPGAANVLTRQNWAAVRDDECREDPRQVGSHAHQHLPEHVSYCSAHHFGVPIGAKWLPFYCSQNKWPQIEQLKTT